MVELRATAWLPYEKQRGRFMFLVGSKKMNKLEQKTEDIQTDFLSRVNVRGLILNERGTFAILADHG
jgi:hypothetical protein